jgi:YegS/Rv2252/BmrU family lipid kinase
LIANAKAGTQDETAVRAATAQLRRLDVDVEAVTTEDPDDLDATLAARAGRDVIVAGGDGSLHAVIEALARRGELPEPTIGLIPLGTGNDFARGVGIPFDAVEAARAFATGEPRQIDLIADDTGGVAVNAVNLGVGAEAARRADDLKPRFGKVGYAVGAVVAGLTATGLRLRVEADGRALADGSSPILQVGIGNGRFVGGGTALTPRADPSDERADVLVSFAVGLLRRLRYGVQLRRRAHLDRDDVVAARARVVRVSGEPFWCSVDGELVGPRTDCTWTLRPRAFTLAARSRPAS